MRALAARGGDFAELALLAVVDEEWRTGGFAHGPRFAGYDACLCFEAGQLGPDGEEAVVAKRKAAATLRVLARGVAAHSGSAPEKGRNALLALGEAARLVAALSDPAGDDRLTATPTVLRAGDAFNVVPADGELVCDLRADRLEALEAVLGTWSPPRSTASSSRRSWSAAGPGWTRASWSASGCSSRPRRLLGRPILAGGARRRQRRQPHGRACRAHRRRPRAARRARPPPGRVRARRLASPARRGRAGGHRGGARPPDAADASRRRSAIIAALQPHDRSARRRGLLSRRRLGAAPRARRARGRAQLRPAGADARAPRTRSTSSAPRPTPARASGRSCASPTPRRSSRRSSSAPAPRPTRSLAFVERMHERVRGELAEPAGPWPAGHRLHGLRPRADAVDGRRDRRLGARPSSRPWSARSARARRTRCGATTCASASCSGCRARSRRPTYRGFRDYWEEMWTGGELHLTDEAREVALAIAFEIPMPRYLHPSREVHNLVLAGTLPPRVRELFGLRWSPLQAAAFTARGRRAARGAPADPARAAPRRQHRPRSTSSPAPSAAWSRMGARRCPPALRRCSARGGGCGAPESAGNGPHSSGS